jgi:hypothetical protein
VQLLTDYEVQPKSPEPLLQSLKHDCEHCIPRYRQFLNTEFQSALPLEYAIRTCEPRTVKLMLDLGAEANPLDMLKIAICRNNQPILAEVLLFLVANEKHTEV